MDKEQLLKMPVSRKSQYNTFGKSVRQMENEIINWSIFKIPGFKVRKNTGVRQKYMVYF